MITEDQVIFTKSVVSVRNITFDNSNTYAVSTLTSQILTFWRPTSTTNDWTTADFDLDGDVDITDFKFLAANFTDTGYVGGIAGGQVPEPAAIVLLLLGSLIWTLWSVRRW